MAMAYLASQLQNLSDRSSYQISIVAFVMNHGVREGSLEEADQVVRYLKKRLGNLRFLIPCMDKI